MKRCFVLLAVAVVVLLASCKDATQVQLVVRSNVTYAAGMNVSVWASHSGAGDAPVAQSAAPWLGDGELGDLYVAPQSGRNDGPLTVRVALGLRGRAAAECVGAADLSGCIVAQRKLSFAPHTKLKIPVVLYAACEGVKCSEDTTCSHLGTCVPAKVDAAACARPEGCTLPDEPPFVPGTQTLGDAGSELTANVAPVDATTDAEGGASDVEGGVFDASDSGAPTLGIDLTAGDDHTCARFDGGTVKCWGAGDTGQGGFGDAQTRGDGPGEMGAILPVVDLGPGRRVLEFGAGGEHTCGRLDDGTVKCWGTNGQGRLGLGDQLDRGDGLGEMGANLPAVNFGPGRTALHLAVGGGHACAKLDDGTVKCWGANGRGQLGLGDTQARGAGPGEMGANLPAVNLGPGRTALRLSAGGQHTCAILDDGSLKCWGANGEGRLGLGDIQNRGDGPGEMGASLPAINLGPGRTAVQLSVGGAHTCAILDDGALKCWGANSNGQLGLGDAQDRGDGPGEMGASLPAINLGPGRTAVQVSAGLVHTCARLDDGSAKCWGRSLQGELGLGDLQDRGDGPGEMGANLPAIDLGPGRTALQVSAGTLHTCASLDDGTVKCWGRNGAGQLGLGDVQNRGDGPGEMGANLPAVPLK